MTDPAGPLPTAARLGAKLWARHRSLCLFAVSGCLALGVDVGLLWWAQPLLGHYGGRLLSFWGAATFTWWFNRTLTFRPTGARTRGGLLAEYTAYLSSMALGGALNYGAYAAAVSLLPLVHRHPALGVALGSLVGMGFNFWSARRILRNKA
ncbi:GtrA family protein [Aquabacterium sp.]|uniref:GtrA family protein n=1 Tax=Aquabacterium sp. TaxID=1872578 RepID=UPI0025B92CB7|nr:GtrA family protein [Aquabacterium sp.]